MVSKKKARKQTHMCTRKFPDVLTNFFLHFADDYYYESPVAEKPTPEVPEKPTYSKSASSFMDDYHHVEKMPPTTTKGKGTVAYMDDDDYVVVHIPEKPTKGKGVYMDDDYVVVHVPEKPTKGKGAYMDDDYVEEKPTYTKGKGTYMDDDAYVETKGKGVVYMDDDVYYHNDDHYYHHPIKICPPKEPPAKGKGKGYVVLAPVGPPVFYYHKGGKGSSKSSKKMKSKSTCSERDEEQSKYVSI
jgi:hypothetical protein